MNFMFIIDYFFSYFDLNILVDLMLTSIHFKRIEIQDPFNWEVLPFFLYFLNLNLDLLKKYNHHLCFDFNFIFSWLIHFVDKTNLNFHLFIYEAIYKIFIRHQFTLIIISLYFTYSFPLKFVYLKIIVNL